MKRVPRPSPCWWRYDFRDESQIISSLECCSVQNGLFFLRVTHLWERIMFISVGVIPAGAKVDLSALWLSVSHPDIHIIRAYVHISNITTYIRIHRIYQHAWSLSRHHYTCSLSPCTTDRHVFVAECTLSWQPFPAVLSFACVLPLPWSTTPWGPTYTTLWFLLCYT